MASTAQKTQTLRAVLYCRVSRDDRRQGRSVIEQETEGRAVAAAQGWTVDGVVVDNDRSASRFANKTREAWPSLVADLEVGKYHVLVLWEPSRGSRDLVVWAALLDTCRRHGIHIHVTSHGRTYDVAHPRDWRSLAEDGVDSAYESEKTSQRILRAMTANAVAGRPHGRCPYGYVRTYDPRTGSLTGQAVDPETAPVVREIIRRIAASEPVSALTNDLNRRSIPSPAGKTWQRAVVRKVALNPAYIAQRTHEDETHPGTWEPVVSEADFYGARSVLMAPGRVGRRPGKVKHLLSYIGQCGVCEGPLAATEARGYFCSEKQCTQAKIELVDSVVTGAIIARLEREDILADLAGRDEAAASQARDEAARLRARLDDFRDTAAMGELTASSLAHVEARLVPQIQEAERRAETAGMPAGLRALTGVGTVRAKWDSMPIAARREVVRMLAHVHLHPAQGRGRHAAQEFDRVRVEWKAGAQPA